MGNLPFVPLLVYPTIITLIVSNGRTQSIISIICTRATRASLALALVLQYYILFLLHHHIHHDVFVTKKNNYNFLSSSHHFSNLTPKINYACISIYQGHSTIVNTTFPESNCLKHFENAGRYFHEATA